jgi:hypothetical protein
MAAGGANVAAGGYSTSIFSNPAGIANIPTVHGLVVEILGVGIGASAGFADFGMDLMDAADTEDEDEILGVLQDYAGEPFQADISNYSSISYNHGDIAWTVGLLTGTQTTMYVHPNSLGMLNVNARGYGGVTSAVSYTLRDLWIGDLSLGLGGKYIMQSAFTESFDPGDIVDFEETGDSISDQLEDVGSGFGIDLGAIYTFDAPLNPSLGMSVLDMGSMDFDNSYYAQPMTVNFGGSIEPEIPFITRTRVSVDYMDALNANKNYIISPTGQIIEADDSDFIKRTRFGATALIFDNSWTALELAAGMYQGNFTGGVDLTLAVFRFNFATYAEEMGPAAGDKTDRRYAFNIGLGF